MTSSPLRPFDTKATFEQTLGALEDPALRADADLAELALSAIFGGAPSTEPQGASSPAGADAEEPTEPDPSPPRPGFSFGAPANDDDAAVRPPSPRTIVRTARRLRLVAVLAPALLVGVALCTALAQFQLGRYGLLPRLGIIFFTSGGALAIGIFLHDSVRMQAVALRAHTVELRRMAERLRQMEAGLQAHARQTEDRSASLTADIGDVAERLNDVIAAIQPEPAAPLPARDDASRQVLAGIVALDARVSQGLAEMRADMVAAHDILRQSLATVTRSGSAIPGRTSELDAPGPDTADEFTLLCDGLLALARGQADTDPLRLACAVAGATIESIFDPAKLLEVWDIYRRDGIATFDDAYRANGLDIVARLRSRIQTDPPWRDDVEICLERTEAKIMTAAQSGSTYLLVALLSSVDGRCYTLLAHASRRVDSRDASD